MATEKAKNPQLRDEQDSRCDRASWRSLPPINALRAFEAAARCRQIASAAAELNVTPSAISHQLRTLEEWLGMQLFQRKVRPLALTPEGETYSRNLTRAFDSIFEATRSIQHQNFRAPLAISTMGSFATNWLVPRLRELQNACVGLDIRISVTDRYVEFERERIDAAVRYGAGRWKNVESELLVEDVVVAVASPALFERHGGTTSLQELTLLQDAAHPDWKEWFKLQGGMRPVAGAKSVFFTHTHLALQAALSGAGVALASEILVCDMIQRRELVRVGSHSLHGSGAYYLVYPPDRASDERLQAFRTWTREALSQSGKVAGGEWAL